MVRTRAEVVDLAKRYEELVSKAFKVDSMYLFGSYAYGKPGKYSDVDIAIVSPDFENIPEVAVLKILFKMARHIDPIIEPVALTQEEIEKPQLGSVVIDILKKGTRLV